MTHRQSSHLSFLAAAAPLAALLLIPAPAAWAVTTTRTVAHSAPALQPSQALAIVADRYYRDFYALFPMTATENTGDAAYEDQFEIEIAPEHRERERALYERTLKALQAIDRHALDTEEQLTYDLLRYDAHQRLGLLAYPGHLLPMTHMDSVPVQLAQWASGSGSQPMKTVANYEHFLVRLQHLPAWVDQAIANMQLGMQQGITQPRPLMERLMVQLNALLPADATQSPYLAGVRHFPASFSDDDKARLGKAYEDTVAHQVTPAVHRLRDFMQQRYLPACRTTAGLGAMPNGAAWYRALVERSTTTTMSPDEIHALGLREVARIRGEMDKVKTRMGFEGDLAAFFKWLDSRAELRPFHSEQEVLDAYNALNRRVMAGLPRLFERAPKAPLEVRAVEPMRRDTASDYYVPPAEDGSRPGVFFTVVRDPANYRTTGMTALFLHEGQPGHHYQMALQGELPVPRFRRSVWYDAYGEGWALYAESLGTDLGLYDDPNAYLGRLFMELHRALRLVVDTGLHAKGWTREQTIAYLREMEGSTEDSARKATERYMAWPGQALAYKVGELKIRQLRDRAQATMGPRFDLRAFHTQVLSEGCLPLSMLEARLDAWMNATNSATANRANATPADATHPTASQS